MLGTLVRKVLCGPGKWPRHPQQFAGAFGAAPGCLATVAPGNQPCDCSTCSLEWCAAAPGHGNCFWYAWGGTSVAPCGDRMRTWPTNIPRHTGGRPPPKTPSIPHLAARLPRLADTHLGTFGSGAARRSSVCPLCISSHLPIWVGVAGSACAAGVATCCSAGPPLFPSSSLEPCGHALPASGHVFADGQGGPSIAPAWPHL